MVALTHLGYVSTKMLLQPFPASILFQFISDLFMFRIQLYQHPIISRYLVPTHDLWTIFSLARYWILLPFLILYLPTPS